MVKYITIVVGLFIRHFKGQILPKSLKEEMAESKETPNTFSQQI